MCVWVLVCNRSGELRAERASGWRKRVLYFEKEGKGRMTVLVPH